MKDCKCHNAKTLSIFILFVLFGLFIVICAKYIVNYYKLKTKHKLVIESFDNNSKYKNYNGLEKDPLYLSIKNAANISYLKGQIDELYKMREEIKQLNAQEKQNAQYNNEIQKQYGQEAEGIQNALNSPDENNDANDGNDANVNEASVSE
jgi:hypothetical protein